MPFGQIGIGGLVLILIIALILFGPSKLPELGRAFGRTLSEFKSATRGLVNGSGDSGEDRKDGETTDVQPQAQTQTQAQAASGK